MVRNAIEASRKLRGRSLLVFPHGSYRNHVNVRRESDVDIGVLCRDTFSYELPESRSPSDYRIVPATYPYSQFKDEVGEALADYFGGGGVTRGNKAFDLRENSYRVEADVTPFFEHRDYRVSDPPPLGVELRPDSGGRIVNWPEQHYDNGVAKNTATGRAFKGCVRILKRTAVALDEAKRAGSVPGFLIECLTFNVPDSHFSHNTWGGVLRAVLPYQYQATKQEDTCAKWTEVSRLKWLFGPHQRWTPQQANDFTVAAWQLLGLDR